MVPAVRGKDCNIEVSGTVLSGSQVSRSGCGAVKMSEWCGIAGITACGGTSEFA